MESCFVPVNFTISLTPPFLRFPAGTTLKAIDAGISEDIQYCDNDNGDDEEPSESGNDRYIAVPRREMTKHDINIGFAQRVVDFTDL